MTSFTKQLTLICFLFFLAVFPFFEGGETPTGLFLIHSATLLLLAVQIMSSSRILLPRLLALFLPFLLAILISTLVAPYKYAAFLQLWDYVVAALFAIAMFSVMRENGAEIDSSLLYGFFASATAILITVLLKDSMQLPRISGSFVNPNHFASYVLLLMMLGAFLLEQRSGRVLQILLAGISALLLLSFFLASSRTAYLAALALFLLFFIKRKPGRKIAVLGALVFLVGAGALIYRFVKHPDPFQYYRLKIWKYSLTGIAGDPYLGIGLNMLSHAATKFNFPADVELGRYARIARSADNQYFQILAETGFLGFFTFIVGWLAIFAAIKKLPDRFFFLKSAFAVVSVLGLFSLPLHCTSVLFLFLLLTVIPLSLSGPGNEYSVRFNTVGRIGATVFLFLVFIFCVYLPFAADRAFSKATHSESPEEAEHYLHQAARYNPYQPYYKFAFVKRIVDAKPKLDAARWAYLIQIIHESIELNPVEAQFYVYRARIYSQLLQQSRRLDFYSMAVSSYQTGLDNHPYNVFLRLEFAAFLLQNGREHLAESEIKKSLEIEPAYLNAWLLLSEMKLRQNDIETAKTAFREFERLYQRYHPVEQQMQPEYARRLIQVDPKKMKFLAQRLSS